MSIADGVLGELKISDILTFLTVQRCGTISSAARELVVTPSQVSKSVNRLEELLGMQLLSRSANGVTLLDEGRRLVPQLEQMLELARTLKQPTSEAPLTLAAPSYLATYFAPLLALALANRRICVLERPPAQIRSLIPRRVFDVALSLGELPLSSTWESQPVGEVEKALFASPATMAQLGTGPIAIEKLATLPIISPIYLTDGGVLPVDDDGPLPRRERTIGHEVMTFGLGLAIAARTDQLVFGPVIGALSMLETGAVVRVTVKGWSSRETLKLAYNTERITKPQQRNIVATIEAGLAAIRY